MAIAAPRVFLRESWESCKIGVGESVRESREDPFGLAGRFRGENAVTQPVDHHQHGRLRRLLDSPTVAANFFALHWHGNDTHFHGAMRAGQPSSLDQTSARSSGTRPDDRVNIKSVGQSFDRAQAGSRSYPLWSGHLSRPAARSLMPGSLVQSQNAESLVSVLADRFEDQSSRIQHA